MNGNVIFNGRTRGPIGPVGIGGNEPRDRCSVLSPLPFPLHTIVSVRPISRSSRDPFIDHRNNCRYRARGSRRATRFVLVVDRNDHIFSSMNAKRASPASASVKRDNKFRRSNLSPVTSSLSLRAIF